MRSLDIAATPSDEPCAQLGTCPDASHWSRQEAIAYRAALIAVCGPPPPPYALTIRANSHDFGTYFTLTLRCPDDSALQSRPYESLIEDGLRFWHQAVMSAPVDYSDPRQPRAKHPTHSGTETIIGAIIATRPVAQSFPLPLFETINRNLRLVFPDLAALADQRLDTPEPATTIH